MAAEIEIADVQRYKCTKCNSSYTSRNSLKRHELTHSGNMIECDLCSKKFFTKHHLKIHIQSAHQGVTFPCAECGKSFATKLGRFFFNVACNVSGNDVTQNSQCLILSSLNFISLHECLLDNSYSSVFLFYYESSIICIYSHSYFHLVDYSFYSCRPQASAAYVYCSVFSYQR